MAKVGRPLQGNSFELWFVISIYVVAVSVGDAEVSAQYVGPLQQEFRAESSRGICRVEEFGGGGG
jgi:hypothetical protein